MAGFIIGLLVAIVRTIQLKRDAGGLKRAALGAAKLLLNAYIEVFRGTPMIVQAMVVYYGASQYLGLNLPAMTAAFLVVSINTGAYMAEIVRGGILSVDAGRRSRIAGRMTLAGDDLRDLQAIWCILPSVGSEFNK